MKLSYASAALLLVAASVAVAQKNGMGNKVMGPDKMFMVKASHTNWNEISLAKLAKQKSKNSEVLRYADMMIRDHTMMQTELKALASKRGTMVPEKPDAKGMAMASKLRNMSGMSFDRMYMQANVAGHKEAYALATRARRGARNAAVRAYFTKGAPKIKMHLDMAQKDMKAMMSGKPMNNMAGMKHGSGR